jgi:hypothetical protein
MTVQTIEFRLYKLGIAFRTYSVAKLGGGMFADVSFNLLPVIPIITDFLAIRTDGQQSLKRLDAGNSRFQFTDALGQSLLKLQDANSSLYPGAQLLAIEGLGNVIVGAGVKALDLVFLPPPRGQ